MRMLSPDFEKNLRYYTEELLKWNRQTALVSLKEAEREDFYFRHIEDSLQILRYLHHTDRTVGDIGSGNGTPGLVCAIADPNEKRCYVLFEKKKQKVTFLKYIIAALKLENVTVAEGDVFQIKIKEKFDVLISRAFTYGDLGPVLLKNLLKKEKNGFFFAGEYNKNYSDHDKKSCMFNSLTEERSKISRQIRAEN